MPTERLDIDSIKTKRPYKMPQLTVYGAVRELTQAGSGKSSENEPVNGAQCGQTTKSLWVVFPCAPSDRTIKQNLVRIGEHPLGIGLYLFDYKPALREQYGHGRQFGVMAQEVEGVMPEAVSIHPDGFKMVNYKMLGIDRAVH